MSGICMANPKALKCLFSAFYHHNVNCGSHSLVFLSWFSDEPLNFCILHSTVFPHLAGKTQTGGTVSVEIKEWHFPEISLIVLESFDRIKILKHCPSKREIYKCVTAEGEHWLIQKFISQVKTLVFIVSNTHPRWCRIAEPSFPSWRALWSHGHAFQTSLCTSVGTSTPSLTPKMSVTEDIYLSVSQKKRNWCLWEECLKSPALWITRSGEYLSISLLLQSITHPQWAGLVLFQWPGLRLP